PRTAPLAAFAVRTLGEIHGVPEFSSDKFRRMVIDADHAAAPCRKFRGRAVELLVALLHRPAAIQRRSHGIPAHVENVEQASVPEWLIIESHLRTLIEINRNTHAAQGRVGLGSPGTPRLAVATGEYSKNPLQVQRA